MCEKGRTTFSMRYKNGVLSAICGILQQVLTLIFGLIVPRLFIRTFGSEMNGFLSSLASLYSYLALLEAGVGTAAIQALYGPLGRQDKKSINEIMSATAHYYNRAGLLYLIGTIAIAVIYPLTVSTDIPKLTIFIVCILNGLGGVINFWVQGKYTVLLQAEGKKYLMSIVTMIIYITSNLMKVFLLKLGFDVITIYIGYFAITLCQMLFYLVYIKRNYKWLDLHEKENRKALSQSGAVLVQEIARMICHNTDVLVLTYVAKDLASVSVYTVYLMIYSAVERLFSTLFGSFYYLLGQTYNNDRDHYLSMHEKYEAISMTGAFAAYFIAFILTGPFIKIYTAGITDAKYVDPYLPLLFTVMKLLACSREASSRVINFAGHFKQMRWRAILEAAINLIVSVVLVAFLGIYGVLLGTIVAFLWRANDIIIYANKVILQRSAWKTYRRWIINVLWFAVLYFGFRFVSLPIHNMFSFFCWGAVCGIIVCCLFYLELILFDKDAALFLNRTIKKTAKRLIPKRS